MTRQLLKQVPTRDRNLERDIQNLSDQDLDAAATAFCRLVETRVTAHQARLVGCTSVPSLQPIGSGPIDWTAYPVEIVENPTEETVYNVSKSSNFHGVLDTACARTCHGSEWGDRFRAYLDEKGIAYECVAIDVTIRGVGGRVRCTKMYRWPCGLFGKPGEIASIEIPDSAAPLQSKSFGRQGLKASPRDQGPRAVS